MVEFTKVQEFTGVTWEHVADRTHRLKVPGGWLYRVVYWPNPGWPHPPGTGYQMSVTFVAEAPSGTP